MSDDRELRECLERLAGHVDRAGVWASIEARAATRGSAKSRAGLFVWARQSRLRVATLATLAVVVLAAVGIGAGLAIQRAADRPLLVIGDDPAGAGALAGSAADPGTWEQLPLTWDGGPVYSIAIDPSDSSVVYAGTGEGVYKSTDGAGHWSRVLAAGGARYTVSLDPGSPTRLFATRVPHVPGAAPVMWRSDDDGATWEDLTATELGQAIRRDWAENDGGMEPYAQFDTSTVPSTVYVLLDSGWMRSSDGGETWSRPDKREAEAAQASMMGSVGRLDLRLFPGAGLYGPPVLADAADGTTRVVDTTAADPRDASVIYAGTEEGLYRSIDGGMTWERKSDGLVCSAVSTLLVAPDSASTLYAVTPREMWKSVDGGATWDSMLASGALDLRIDGNGSSSTWDCGSLVVAPSSPSTLYAWTRDGLLRSDDAGEQWTHLFPQGLPAADSRQEGMVGFDCKLLLVSAAVPDIVFGQALGGSIVRSTDGGRTWIQLPEAPWYLVPDPNDPSTLYGLGLVSEDGQIMEPVLRKSVDAGAVWTTISMPPDRSPAWWDIFVDASRSPSALYGVSGDGSMERWSISTSLDGGATWQGAGLVSPTGGNCQLFFDPTTPGTVYADTHEFFDERHVRGLYRSTDGGATWEGIIGEMAGDEYFQLVMDPVKGTLYAYSEAGVFRWDPDGE